MAAAGYPEPTERGRVIDVRHPDVPKAAVTAYERLSAAGWRVGLMRAEGVPPNGDGSARMGTIREPVTTENGEPALTPTGRVKMQEMSTGEHVRAVALRLVGRHDGVEVWAHWVGGKFDAGGVGLRAPHAEIEPQVWTQVTPWSAWIKDHAVAPSAATLL